MLYIYACMTIFKTTTAKSVCWERIYYIDIGIKNVVQCSQLVKYDKFFNTLLTESDFTCQINQPKMISNV